MKKRLRLTDEEAKILGLQIPQTKKHKNARYTITTEQLKEVYIYRGYDPALIGECVDKGISPEKIRHYWHKSEHFSLNVQEEKQDQSVKIGEVFDEIIEKHLKDFIDAEKLSLNITGNTDLSSMHSIAFMVVEEVNMPGVRDALKPHRGEVYSE